VEYKINVKSVHLAEITESPEGTLTFGTPEHMPGAMEIGREPEVASGELRGDGKIAHTTSRKNAYKVTISQNKLSSKWRRYMEGVTVNSGVESGTSKDEPKPFAMGWEVEKTGGKKELIWFLYGKADPFKETVKQSEENINYSTDNITITFIEHDSLGRFYTFIDSEDADVTPEMVTDFFKKVQTTDAIAAPQA